MLLPKLVDLYEHLDKANKHPDQQQPESLLLLLCGSFNRTFVLIDALDECTIAAESSLFLST
jgi:hypothetical protein